MAIQLRTPELQFVHETAYLTSGRDAKPPEYIFTDRGPGFYHPSAGGIFGNLLGDARLPMFAEGGGYCANVYP